MVGELLAAGEGTQTKSLWILQPSHLLGSGSTTTPTTTLSPQSGLTSTWGKNSVGRWDSNPLTFLSDWCPILGFAPPDGTGAIDRTRTCYLSLTKRAHYLLCFDGWCLK